MTEVDAVPTFVDRLKVARGEIEAAKMMVQGLDPHGTIKTKLNMAHESLDQLLGIVEEVNRIAPGDVSRQNTRVRIEANPTTGGERTGKAKS